MIEEKDKQQPAPPPPATRRQKLRSLWAQVQCIGLLRRHRLRRSRQRWVEAFFGALTANPLTFQLGELLYTLGFATEYLAVCAGRWCVCTARGLLHGCRRALRELADTAFPGAAQVCRDLFGPLLLFGRGVVRLVVGVHHTHRQQGFGAAVQGAGQYVRQGVRKNIALLPRMAMYILPLCALGGMLAVVQYAFGQPYVLSVQVNGQTVGYVENEEVFDSARDAVQQRINYAGTDRTEWSVEPSYTIALSHEVMDENGMANAILRASGDEIGEGTALYLDSTLIAVCAEGDTLRSYLSSLLAPYQNPADEDLKVGFNKEVTLENGIYFNDSFQDVDEVEQMLAGVQQAKKTYVVQPGDSISLIASKNGLTMRELCALNADIGLTAESMILPGNELTVTKEEAMLEVRLTKLVSWEEEIPYTTETTKSNEYTQGTKKVEQEGRNGLRLVTAQNICDASGTVLEQTILGAQVLEEPVTEKVIVGTKPITSSTTQITGSGQFIWPVPQYRYCSRWYGGSHHGVDICAPAGTPIYASAGGTVAKAGFNRAGAGTGYGYSIILNHSGGYSTVYAHCISLVVQAGQTVKQGQLIGYVGSTGRSSGNHCHFEIRKNGSYIPPQNVFNRSSYRNS